ANSRLTAESLPGGWPEHICRTTHSRYPFAQGGKRHIRGQRHRGISRITQVELPKEKSKIREVFFCECMVNCSCSQHVWLQRALKDRALPHSARSLRASFTRETRWNVVHV